jgi:hypothetical protein
MTRDEEIAAARSALERAVEEYRAFQNSVDRLDTFRSLGLRGNIATAERKLANLENKEANDGAPLRSAAIYFSSDH